jgi:hypothetical protein
MSTASSSVNLVFENREELAKFLATINGARIKVDDESWLQWSAVELGHDSVALFEFCATAVAEPEIIEPQLVIPQDSDLI